MFFQQMLPNVCMHDGTLLIHVHFYSSFIGSGTSASVNKQKLRKPADNCPVRVCSSDEFARSFYSIAWREMV